MAEDRKPVTAKNFGLPKHVDPKELVPDATRADHYVWPHPSGNPAQDEVYHMPAEFGRDRSEEEEDHALKLAGKTRQQAAESDADGIIEAAKARAEAIIAEAEGQAKALKARGTMYPGPRDASHDYEENLDPETGEPRTGTTDSRGKRTPPPRAANVIDPKVTAASNPSGADLVPGRDNPNVHESSA